jgi:hypothetical protein
MPRPARSIAAIEKGWTMSEYEVELVSKNRRTVIGGANNALSALNFMDEAIRVYPRVHIRIRCGATIISERVPPRIPG